MEVAFITFSLSDAVTVSLSPSTSKRKWSSMAMVDLGAMALERPWHKQLTKLKIKAWVEKPDPQG